MSVMENVVVRRKVAAVDLEMYGELVQTYRATLTASGEQGLGQCETALKAAGYEVQRDGDRLIVSRPVEEG